MGQSRGILSLHLKFFVVAFCLFLLIRSFEAMKTKMARQKALEAPAAPDPAVLLQEQMISSFNRVATALENRQI